MLHKWNHMVVFTDILVINEQWIITHNIIYNVIIFTILYYFIKLDKIKIMFVVVSVVVNAKWLLIACMEM